MDIGTSVGVALTLILGGLGIAYGGYSLETAHPPLAVCSYVLAALCVVGAAGVLLVHWYDHVHPRAVIFIAAAAATAAGIGGVTAFLWTIRAGGVKPTPSVSVQRPRVFIKSSKLYQALGTSDKIDIELWISNGGDIDAAGELTDISFRFDPSEPPIRLQYQPGVTVRFDLAPTQDTYLRLSSTLPMTPEMIKALNEGTARLYVFSRGSYTGGKGDTYPLPFCRMYHPTMPGNLIHCPEDTMVGEVVGQSGTLAQKPATLEERPYLAAESMTLTELAVGNVVSIDVVFKNTSLRLAQNVTTNAVVWSQAVDDVDAPCPELPQRQPLKFLSKGTLGVNDALTIPVRTGKPLTAAQSEALHNRLVFLYVYAIAEYEDGGRRYLTEAYGRYDVAFRGFIRCDKHNRAT
jgi:hypothetical protein